MNIKGIKGLAKCAINYVVITITNCLFSITINKNFY